MVPRTENLTFIQQSSSTWQVPLLRLEWAAAPNHGVRIRNE